MSKAKEKEVVKIKREKKEPLAKSCFLSFMVIQYNYYDLRITNTVEYQVSNWVSTHFEFGNSDLISS